MAIASRMARDRTQLLRSNPARSAASCKIAFCASVSRIKIVASLRSAWLKAHLMCGVKTNVVTSCEVTEGNAHDSPEFAGLLAKTQARGFEIKEVSADKGYVSRFNSAAVLLAGATPYIPFKSNSTGKGPAFWRKLFHFYQYNRDEFLAHYHKRSNSESTNWMIKSKFGAALRSKTFTAQVNELLCKIVCHNLAVLVSLIYELGIEPTFWANKADAHNGAAH